MAKTKDYCVLMSVYFREEPEHLRLSLKSMLTQTIPPRQLVLVADGKLTPALDEVIADICSEYPDIMEVVQLPENGGLAHALNEGLKHCRYEFVARMDSDDIAMPRRCSYELFWIQRTYAEVVSCTVAEFEDTPEKVTSYKTLPKEYEDIIYYARTRNPFNHPAVMFRKSAVLAVGGYEDYRFFEDYQLWVKMLDAGYRGFNLHRPLLWMRTGSGMFKRRGGVGYVRCAKRMEQYKLSIGFCTKKEYRKRMTAITLFGLSPAFLRERLYKGLLRH
ncbi:MAG: glycosyltransferase [Ruminococcus sp.]|nr:glycosyltransferase [Ruminococcus sp.]